MTHKHLYRAVGRVTGSRVRTCAAASVTFCWLAIGQCAPVGAGAAEKPAEASTAVPSVTQLADANWIRSGRELFVQTCAYCHGQEGDAGKNRPFRERINWDAGEIHDTIAEGRKRGANIMPAWKDSLTEEQIWKMVAYIKSLGGQPRKAD